MDTLLQMLWRQMAGHEMPYNSIILRAFQQIEQTPELLNEYRVICRHYQSGEHYVNPHIAQSIKKHYGLTKTGVRSQVTNETSLIKSYSELR